MIITFCGHSDFQGSLEYERKILDFLEENIGDSFVELYLGGYGAFDRFAYDCCKKFQTSHQNVKLIFVTPYINGNCRESNYDAIVYPEIEDKPLKFAISYRNKWMVQKADYVIAFIERSFGGAYQTYKYAKNMGKKYLTSRKKMYKVWYQRR